MEAKRSITFVTALRGVAALLVIWDHLIGTWAMNQRVTWVPLTFVQRNITTPLGIIQDFGFFAVVLFFVISGFIITHVAQRENFSTFIVKRLFRIFPPFILSVALIYLLHQGYAAVTGNITDVSQLSPGDAAWAMTLLNYMKVNQHPINGVAWTLVIEMEFYLAVFLLLPLIQRRPKVALGCEMALVLLVGIIERNFGPNFFLFAVSIAYLPFLIMGQTFYYLWSGRISLRSALVLGVTNYAILVHSLRSIYPNFLTPNNSYLISFAYAFGLFVCCAMLRDRLRVPRALEFCADTSYSLYLYHGGIGLLLLRILYPRLLYPIALLIALTVVFCISYASTRWIERPAQRLARWLLALRLLTRERKHIPVPQDATV